MNVTRALSDISHGDHCCLLFSNEEDQVEVTVPFLATGLERGERSVYLGDPASIERMREGLRLHGVNVERERSQERLVLDLNRDFLDDGRFTPDRMLGFLQQAYDETIGRGFTALRAAGDVSWQVGPRRDFRDVVYYEALLDVFFRNKRLVGMCQYPRHRCPPEVLAGVLNTHGTALLDQKVCDNFHYLPPELLIEMDPEVREKMRLEWMVSQLDRVRQAEREQTRLQDQLNQSQKMEAIGRLAGGVAHDFNNIVTVIMGNSELIAENATLDPIAEGALQEVQDAADRATRLTRQLLAFSRKQVLQPRVIDLNEVVENVDRFLRRLIGADIDLVTRMQKDLGRVRVDPSQVEQVILNLAVNARDAMPQGGKLTVETGNAMLDEEYCRLRPGVSPGRYVMLSVTDSGTGMSPEVKARIFEPFFTTKGADQGTGLGLATVYGIVKQSGGDVWVYSEAGKGTTFKVYFPSVGEEVPVEESVAPVGPARAGETILVVEDEPALRRLFGQVLESGGYQVLTAANSEEAIRLCRSQGGPIHLVLLDVVLPGTSGPVLAGKLRAAKPDLRIVFMSGYADDAIVRHGELEPGTEFIAKPVSARHLLDRLAQVLQS